MGKIRDLATTVTAFKLNYVKGLQVYNKSVSYVKQNYVKGSKLYRETLEKYDTEFEKEKQEALNKTTDEVQAAFDSVRNEIEKAVATLPTDRDRAIMELLKNGNLLPEEIGILAGQVSNTYFGMRELSVILNREFTPVGAIVKTLDNTEKQTLKALGYVFADPESPTVGAITKGEYLGEAEDTFEAFLKQYRK